MRGRRRGGEAGGAGRDRPRSRQEGQSEIAAQAGESTSEIWPWPVMPARLPAGLVTQADHLWTGGPQRGPFPVARLPYLVNVPDRSSTLRLQNGDSLSFLHLLAGILLYREVFFCQQFAYLGGQAI